MKFNNKLTREKKKLHDLDNVQKAQYIWDYYRMPIIIVLILFYIIGYIAYRHFTHKEPLLYTALVNVSASDSLCTQLSTDFLDYLETDTEKKEFLLYAGLYLTDDKSNPYYQYTYASQMKILASIENQQLDVVLMNQEAFDAFSQNGYLCNLEELLTSTDSDLYQQLKPCLVTNAVIPEESQPSIAEEYPMGLDMSKLPGILQEAGFESTVYLGIVENSPRKDLSIEYIKYLGKR